MSERFIKVIPSEEAMWLLKKKGHAFRLLAIIAESARRVEGDPDGLNVGECFIGGHENYDMTERNYRTAKDTLVKRRHLEIVETCRTRKKATTGSTTVGTKVRLLSSNVWDINLNTTDDRNDDWPTTDRRPTDDRFQGSYNDKEREEREEREEEESYARLAKRPRISDPLIFNFDLGSFEGIEANDVAEWKVSYPHIDVAVETIKAANWLKSNPSKSKKKLWRKYLTGWFGRSNERMENKKAFSIAGNAGASDRRTKDIVGNPVENQYEGKF